MVLDKVQATKACQAFWLVQVTRIKHSFFIRTSNFEAEDVLKLHAIVLHKINASETRKQNVMYQNVIYQVALDMLAWPLHVIWCHGQIPFKHSVNYC